MANPSALILKDTNPDDLPAPSVGKHALFADSTNYNLPAWKNSDGSKTSLIGPQGTQGWQGNQGVTGAQGAQGSQGSVGAQGSTGAQGTTGSQGPQGDIGPQGSQGNQGTQGTQGSQGAQGSQGNQGAQGAGGSPGGSNTQIQFNDSSAFGGDVDLTWDKTNNILALGSSAITGFALAIAKTLTWPSDVTAGHVILHSAAASAKRLVFGVDNTLNSAFIAYGELSVGWKILALQPSGGSVTIGNDAINNASTVLVSTSSNIDALYVAGTATTRVSAGVRNYNTTASARAELNIWNENSNNPFRMYKYSTTTATSGSGATASANLMRMWNEAGHVSIAAGVSSGLNKIFIMPGGVEVFRAVTSGVLISGDSAGNAANSDPGAALHVKGSIAGQHAVWCQNISSNGGAYTAYFAMGNNTGDNIGLYKVGDSFTTSGLWQAKDGVLQLNTNSGTQRLLIVNTTAAPIILATAGTGVANEVARFNTIATGTIEFLGNSNAGLNSEQGLRVYNKNASSGAFVTSLIINNNGDYFGLGKGSTTFANSGLLNANSVGWIVNHTGATVYINDASQPHIFSVGGSAAANEIARFDSTSLTLKDAINFAVGTTTGTKIGTATSQKLGFWNATPIVQPTTAIAAATFVANTSAIVDDTATFDGYTIGQVVKALRNMGKLA